MTSPRAEGDRTMIKTIRISRGLARDAEKAARDNGETFTSLIKKLLMIYLDRDEKYAR
ncbi:MAG: hypothetical protein ACOYXY_01030 [Thermodesulfobacteriota bacterium]